MAWTLETNWKATQVLDVAGSADTSTGATEVETNAGRAYVKPLGNRQGPHVLATDWVGTHLARWLGLSTFEVAIVSVSEPFELPRGAKAKPGPAFAARAMAGDPWGKSGLLLNVVENPEDITRLVVFDTWTLNCDRYYHDPTVRKPNYDNVYLATAGPAAGRRRLIAMDHGLCFIRSGEELSPKLAGIDKVKDDHLYGLFPEFRDKLRAHIIEGSTQRLREMDRATAEAMIATVPDEWDVSSDAQAAWAQLIYRRAGFVADNIRQWIELAVPWFGEKGE